ncbi:MAG: helix-turn-helix domain-containing protein [Candidatus Coprovivens sp.]|nr:helix-turn-helix domain-containing protein [Mycoplasmatota bacterium]
MNFSEKIQKLRKQNNLTQEELAEKLFISRTAISKWESGKGYPSIDVLKQISVLFDISVDNLLSSEQILELAEQDKMSKLKKNNGLIFGAIDLLIIFMIILPLYASTVNQYIYSVSLFAKKDLLSYIKISYLIGYISLIIIGIIEIILSVFGKDKIKKCINIISLVLHLVVILFLIMTKEPYACSLLFILFVFKIVLYFISEKR